MEILVLVRRAAKERISDAVLRGLAKDLAGDWKAAEQTIAADLGASPRRASRVVAAFARVAGASGGREARGRAARLAASHLTYCGRFEESGRAYRESIALLDGAARDGALLGLAAVETRLGRFAAARALCRGLRRTAKSRGDALLAAFADLNEALALHEGGRVRESVRLYERARTGFAAAGNRRLEARTTMDLANAFVLLDRYDDAAPLFDAASHSFASLGQTFDGARCRYNSGALAVATERLGDADVALREAEASFRAAGDAPHAALARLDRGEAMLRAGLVPEAARLVESARRGLTRGVPPVERVRASHLAARAALALGDAQSARRLASLASRASVRGLHGTAAASDEIAGRALALGGRHGAARKRLERAAKGFGGDRPAGRARSMAAAAWCANESGDAKGARRLAAVAARVATPLGVPGLDFAVAAVQFLVEDTAGRRAPARAALDRSIAALERVRAGLGQDTMRAALVTGRETWLARAVRHELAGPRGPEAAHELVERFRARALVDLLGAADAAAPRDARVAKLRARGAVLEKRALGEVQPAFLRSATAAPPRRALRAAERALADAAAASAFAPLLDAADLRRLPSRLPEGTLLVSLYADDAGAMVFTADRGGVRCEPVAGDAGRVTRLVEDLRYTIGKFALGDDFARRHAARLAADTSACLAELSALSLAPVAGAVTRAKRVVVVPHGPWHLVPFAALPVAGRPLVAHAAVALAPAIGALSADVREPNGPSLVLSAADALAPTMDDEARAVAAAIPGARLFTGDDARFDVLARAHEPRCVHVAAHGRFRSDAPSMGGVRLADGWLRAIDFASLRLPGALVVLSGCETGVARVGPGDELHGIVRGVFASGAAELVASLWRVGDEATARFMSAFHGARARGLCAEAALAETQRTAAALGLPAWAWAGFSLWTRRLVAEA